MAAAAMTEKATLQDFGDFVRGRSGEYNYCDTDTCPVACYRHSRGEKYTVHTTEIISANELRPSEAQFEQAIEMLAIIVPWTYEALASRLVLALEQDKWGRRAPARPTKGTD